MTRREAIQSAVEAGATPEQINQVLQNNGEAGLTRYEQALVNRGRYGQNVIQRLGADLFETAQGIGSLGGAAFNYATDPQFRQGVNQAIGDYGNRVITGRTNVLEDVANTFLSPYGTNVQQVIEQPLEAIQQAGANAAAAPLNPILDSMILMPTGTVANAVSRLPGANAPVIRGIRTALLPTERERQINSMVNLSEARYSPANREIADELRALQDTQDINQAVRNLTTGNWQGSEELTNRLLQFTRRIDDEMVKLGLDANDARKTAVSQYVFENINPDRTADIPLQFVTDAIANPTRENLRRIGIRRDRLDQLTEQANSLFDEGRIFPITQRGLNSDQAELIALVDRGNQLSGIRAQRNIGTATPDEVADNLSRGYGLLYKDILNANIAQDTMKELAEKYGRGISPDEVSKVGKGDVIISPTEFKDGVRTLFGANQGANLSDTVRRSTSGLSGRSVKQYANDLYVVSRNDLRALENRFSRPSGGALTAFNQLTRPILGAFKSTTLADLPYFFGNRTGNLILNTMSGAMPGYAEVARRAMRGTLDSDIPEYIRQSTSYSVQAPNLANTFSDTTRAIREAGRRLSGANSTGAERASAALELVTRPQQYITNPIFRAESQFEYLDRAAQYLTQAQRQADRMGKTLDEVIEMAKTNNELQRTLIEGVNDTLGDYVGRNFFINQEARQAAQTFFPFYRIVNTSRDVLRRAQHDNPLGVQFALREPARVGYELQRIDEVNQPENTDTRGGLTIERSWSSRYPRTVIANNLNPLVTPFELGASLLGGRERIAETLQGNMSPITGLFNLTQGLDAYGNPVKGRNTYSSNGTLVTLDENGNRIEDNLNIGGAIVNYARGNLLPAVNMWNTTLAPLIGSITGQGYYRPTSRSLLGTVGQDVNIPYLYEGQNVVSPMTRNFRDYAFTQAGFRPYEVYPQYTPQLNESMLRRVLQQRARQDIRQQQRGE